MFSVLVWSPGEPPDRDRHPTFFRPQHGGPEGFLVAELAGEPVGYVALHPAGTLASHAHVRIIDGLAVLAAGCWWWLSKVMPKVKDGVFERTAAFALQSPAHFDALWAKGVLSLYAKMPDGTERAATRRDSWRNFATAIDNELKGHS